MNRARAQSSCAAVLTSFLAVAGLFSLLGAFYGHLLLPLFRWEISTFFPLFRIMRLGLVRQGTEIFFTLQSVFPQACLVGTTLLPAGTMLTGSTLLGHALQHPIILLPMTIAAWMTQRENGRRLLVFSLLFLFAIELLDVPLVLVGSMENLLLEQFAPGGVSSSFVIYWMNFLNDGGRLALSITGGILAILFGLGKARRVSGQPAGAGGDGILPLTAGDGGSILTERGEQ